MTKTRVQGCAFNPCHEAHAEAFFAATGATVKHGGNRAFYAPSQDYVQMPPRESFRDAEAYCATLAHELTHWTSHPARLARELGAMLIADNVPMFTWVDGLLVEN